MKKKSIVFLSLMFILPLFVLGFTGEIVQSFDIPASFPTGLTFDGKYLWLADRKTDKIYAIDKENGEVVKGIDAPAYWPMGLTWDGKALWNADVEGGIPLAENYKGVIYQIDPKSGCVIIIFQAPGPYTRGLCYDGEFLWAVDYQNDKLYKITTHDNEKYQRSNERKAKITYTHQTTNFGPGKVITLDVHLAIPADRDNQTITNKIRYTPDYTGIVTDKWGQRTAHFHADDLETGSIYEVQMVTTFTAYDVRYFIYPEQVGSLDNIPNEIKEKYLENNAKYQINHPVIQNALKEALGQEKNPYWIARKLYNYLIGKIYYEMVGGWNTAPVVLERGNGSCSEYSFVYISMCRAAGIPVRYVGSISLRGDDSSMDDEFHRWVEIYLPDYGWFPVDPSGGDKISPRDQANSFGFLKNQYLITTQSGGGSETMAWTYNSKTFLDDRAQNEHCY